MQLVEAARDEAAFSMRVLSYLASGAANGGESNVAVSPLSLHAALALLGAGARGATLDQIASFLGPAGGAAHAALASHVALRVLADADGAGSGGGPTVRFANGVWVDNALRLKDGYARVFTQHYRAVARSVPFRDMPDETRRQINQWIEHATAGRIKDLLPAGSINHATRAVLTNAIYFKGAWSRMFDAYLTRDGAFYLPTGGSVCVPFMSSTSKQCIISRHGYKVLRLPYACGGEDRAFSMYIYLPDAQDGLPGLLQKLSSDPALLESDRTMARKVLLGAFRVPKFTVSCNTNATAMLRTLGLRLPFDPAAVDFGDMVESAPEPLFLSEVYHECFVEVNEEGTMAFAATFCSMATTGCPAGDFVADHPFMFLIQEDHSGVVVFAGQVTNPSLSR